MRLPATFALFTLGGPGSTAAGLYACLRRFGALMGVALLSLLLVACGGDDGPTAPSISAQPASVTVKAGASASFSVTASGSGPLTYQWRRNGTNIAGATASTYTLSGVAATDTGAQFSVVVGNEGGTVTSTAATLTVDVAVAPVLTTPPVAQTVTEGGTATFSASATGSDPLAYQWKRNGVNISGATAASYTTPATTVANDNGATYAVVVSNSAGSASSDAVTLTVTAVASDSVAVVPRRLSLEQLGGELVRWMVTADGRVLVLGAGGRNMVANTDVAGSMAGQVTGLLGIASVAFASGGGGRGFAIDGSGSVWAWGSNSQREFGSWTALTEQRSPVRMAGWGAVRDIQACRSGHTNTVLMLKSDGSLQFSPGAYATSGSGQTAATVRSVAGLGGVTAIATSMSNSGTCDFVVATAAGGLHVVTVSRADEAGLIAYAASTRALTGAPAIAEVSCGTAHCLARATDGTAWAWGTNNYGALGDGTTTSRALPVQVQLAASSFTRLLVGDLGYSMAITPGGGLMIWGSVPTDVWNARIGQWDSTPGHVNFGYALPFTLVADGAGLVEGVSRLNDGSWRTSDGRLLSWGDNHDGNLGDGTLTDATILAPTRALGVALN